MTSSSRQRWTEGAILEFAVGSTIFHAQMLKQPEIAFFDPHDPSTVLFRLWVMNLAYTTGRWKKVGAQPFTGKLKIPVPTFKRDRITKELSICEGEDQKERSASYAECVGLEAAAVWSAEHVEEWLKDYVHGRENKWVASLAL